MDTNWILLSFGHSIEVLAIKPHINLHHLLDIWMLIEDCYLFGHSTKVLSLYHQKNLHHLLDVLDANSRLLFFGHLTKVLNLFSANLCFSLFKILMLRNWFLECFHQTFRFSVNFLERPCLVFLGVVKFFFPAAALKFLICVICSFHNLLKIFKLWNDTKV